MIPRKQCVSAQQIQSRRTFLRNAVSLPLAAACGAGALLHPSGAGAELQPIKRAGSSMLKVSMNAFSFSKLLNAKMKHGGEGVDLFDLVDFCAKNNIDGLDPTGYFFPKFPEVPPDTYIYDLKRKAFESGVGIRPRSLPVPPPAAPLSSLRTIPSHPMAARSAAY